MQTEFAHGLFTNRKEACISQINCSFKLLTQLSLSVVFCHQSLGVHLWATILVELLLLLWYGDYLFSSGNHFQ